MGKRGDHPSSVKMTEPQVSVIVVDDDPAMRESLAGLLRTVGLQARSFGSVAEFQKAGRPDGPACLVLDVRLPACSGPRLVSPGCASRSAWPIG
jgi:FixJ family two-component response regulator